jgi:6-phosphogluconate dehydrogenase
MLAGMLELKDLKAYDIMKRGLGLTPKEMSEVFAEWNKGVLDSFLIEITRDVLAFDDDDGKPLVEKILDSAGQKGTGKWTAINALDLGMPVTLIGEVSLFPFHPRNGPASIYQSAMIPFGSFRYWAPVMHSGLVFYLFERTLTYRFAQAVFARCLSSLKQERGRASKLLDGPKPDFSGDKKEFLANLEQALYASKIISYAQGFMLIQNVS